MSAIVPIYTKIIDLIFSNKEMPYYSAERRLDVIFGVFIENILHCYYESPIKLITSEFPLKQDDTNAANEVDYLCQCENQKTLLYVELKTDSKSYNPEQLKTYVKNKDWKNVVKNYKLKTMSLNVNTDDRVKYYRLIKKLHTHGVIWITDPSLFFEIDRIVEAKTQKDRGIRSRAIIELAKLIEPVDLNVKIIYMGPPNNVFEKLLDDNKVDFISFNKLKGMKFDTPYQEEWNLLSSKL